MSSRTDLHTHKDLDAYLGTGPNSCREARALAHDMFVNGDSVALEGMTVWEVLMHCRHMGKAKADKILDDAMVNPLTSANDLSEIQLKNLESAMRPFPGDQ